MKTHKSFIFSVVMCLCIPAWAQIGEDGPDSEQYAGLRQVAIAHQLAVYGYAVQDPVYLITAAKTLADFPVKGYFNPDSIQYEESRTDTSRAGAKDIVLDPYVLLDDASRMAASDSLTLALVSRTREMVKEKEGLPRGRKFNPLVQEYLIEPDGKVKIWETFNGREIAEVFVLGGGSSFIDLFIYDNTGKLLGSDLKNIDNCYVSYTPDASMRLRIEIRNSGKTADRCLLMTN